ncbi:MAG: hypothetical protein KKD31_06855 [Bacteroidetes bacterium]|nr:hypothetical protein [Bacteroidota bacterium]
MLDPEDNNAKIQLAELYRYRSDFDRCMELINDIPSKSFGEVKRAFKCFCSEKDAEVFLISHFDSFFSLPGIRSSQQKMRRRLGYQP